jgi:formylglycine-generating enzyme required for sulfatase activity/uncharacterized caspase-like protein
VRAAIAVLLLVLACSAAHAQKRVALLIGNKDYKQGVGTLLNPLNDVRIVGEALKAVGFEVLKPVHNARRSDMLLAVHDFAAKLKAAGPDAVGFLYYSGHGIASSGENFLIPVDVEEPSTRLLSVAGVKQSEVLAILRSEAPNAAHYLVLDACRNNLQGARGGKGFVPVGQQSGVLVAFAAEPGKTASDIGQGSGPYAAALATELLKPGQNDLLMFHNVRVAVIQKTGGDQVPWTEDGIQRPQRVMFGGESKTAAIAQSALTEAERAWAAAKDMASVPVLEDFAARYKDTFYASLARARIEELKKQVAVALPPKAQAPSAPAKPPQAAIEPGNAVRVAVAPIIGTPDDIGKALGAEVIKSMQARRIEAFAGTNSGAENADYVARGYLVAAIERNELKVSYIWDIVQGGKRVNRFTGTQVAAAIKGGDPWASFPSSLTKTIAENTASLLSKWLSPSPSGSTCDGVEAQVDNGTRCLKSKDTFKDCPECPEMVVVPAGEFMMGSPKTEDGRFDNEDPQHKVTIGTPFAVGKFAVTRDHFEAFVRETNHAAGDKCWTNENDKWEERAGRSFRKPGFTQDGKHPVVCVNWDDAMAFVTWLSKKTSKAYRLLSEAEREYVARAGTTTPFWWGASIETSQANYNGNYTYGGDIGYGGHKGEWRKNTLPVDSFEPNPWGLYQVHGNISEWVEDCWNESYQGAPMNGSAWTTGDCGRRVVRGGSWSNYPRHLRSAFRHKVTNARGSGIGFRLARALSLP